MLEDVGSEWGRSLLGSWDLSTRSFSLYHTYAYVGFSSGLKLLSLTLAFRCCDHAYS